MCTELTADSRTYFFLMKNISCSVQIYPKLTQTTMPCIVLNTWHLSTKTNNPRLPTVVRRYNRNRVPRQQIYWCLYTTNKMGDGYNLMFKCNHNLVSEYRTKYLPKYYVKRPNMFKCVEHLSLDNSKYNSKIAMFLTNVLILYK